MREDNFKILENKVKKVIEKYHITAQELEEKKEAYQKLDEEHKQLELDHLQAQENIEQNVRRIDGLEKELGEVKQELEDYVTKADNASQELDTIDDLISQLDLNEDEEDTD